MKKYILLCMLMGLYSLSIAQIITIKDKQSGELLAWVTIVSENPAVFASTNLSGEADITAFKGVEKIEIRMIGFTTETRSYDQLEKTKVLMLSPSGLSLDQVVVSASRWGQTKREIPANVTTISPKSIALHNPQTAADLLGTSGEVFIQKSQQGGGSPMIRGFSTNRLLITVDGVRMNTAIFRSGNLQNIISLDPFATETAEVFFGPASVIYGSDAIGGVMSFQTLDPNISFSDELRIEGKAVARYASANQEQTGHFDIGLGWKKWAMTTSFTSTDFGDLRMGSHGPEEYLRPFYVQRQDSVDVVVTNDDPQVQRPTGYAQINLMQKLRFRPNDHWDFRYGFHYSATTDYSRYDRHIRLRNGLPRSGEWYYGPQVWMMNHLSVDHRSNSALFDQLTIRLAHQFFEESRIDRDFNKVTRASRVEKVDAYSANFDFSKSISDIHQLYYGFEAVYDKVNSTGTDEDISTGKVEPGPSRYPESTWASYGAYLTYRYAISEQLSLQAGARYNQFVLDAKFDTTFYHFPFTTANINNGALTGSVGFVYTPVEDLSISANASTAFRAPNIDDVGKIFDSEPGAVVVPNPELKAEYAYHAEVGAAKNFGELVEVDVTVFYTRLKDALVRRNFTLNGQDSILYDGTLSQVQAIQNAARTDVYGIQAGVAIHLPHGFGFNTRFNYQKGEEELDDGTTSPSRHAAPWFGTAHLTYTVPNLELDFYTMFSGQKDFDDLPEEEKGKDYIYAIDTNGNPYSPSWYTLNFKALYRLTDHFSVSAGLENLTDQRYRSYSSGIVAPGRNFILSLKATF
ncbi:MAG: hypothetical protein DHS20C18_53120 [Saprospiraceae bacterium]|nr:MAG: hypothetical protein DHS20C18_53120 [Saprospiraceae bacterium]